MVDLPGSTAEGGKQRRDTLQEVQECTLPTQYGHLPSVNGPWLASLFEPFAGTDSAVLEEAIHRHLTNTTLSTNNQPIDDRPPTIAQLVVQIRTIETEHSRFNQQSSKAQHQAREDNAAWTWLELPQEMQHKFPLCDEDGNPIPGQFRQRIRVRKTHCPHCGDTGLARFYYDRRNKSHVFLAPEFLSLPAALQWELRCQTALCDCRPGLDHPKRACTTVIHPHGQQQRVPTWPQLEIIRQLERIGISA